MINDTVTIAATVAISWIAALVVPESLALDIPPEAIGGGGIGVGVVVLARGMFRRFDELIRVAKIAVNSEVSHKKRIENLHRISMRNAIENAAIPSESFEDVSRPIVVDDALFPEVS
jgi:hypothetical protein